MSSSSSEEKHESGAAQEESAAKVGALLTKEDFNQLLQPPPVELPSYQLELQVNQGKLFSERLRESGDTDAFSLFKLALDAEEIREESRLARLLSTEELPEVYDDLPIAGDVRYILQKMHGRAFLSHEPNFDTNIELALLISEYLRRGLVKRVLVLVDDGVTGFWKALLQHHFHFAFETAESMADEIPNRLILPKSALRVGMEGAWEKEGLFELVVVCGAVELRRRRSRFWKNLLALSPRYLVLEEPLPLDKKAVDLHGFLALLGVPDLPPPGLLQREMGPADGPITPLVRSVMTPFLKPVLIRNTTAVHPVQTPTVSWKTPRCDGSPNLAALHKSIVSWVQEEQGRSEEDTLDPRLAELLRANSASSAAVEACLAGWRESGEFEGSRETLSELEELAGQYKSGDPRIQSLIRILQQQSQTHCMIFCQDEATREVLQEILPKYSLPIQKGERIKSSSRSNQEQREGLIYLATDHDIPKASVEVSWIILFDFPWHSEVLEQRVFWMCPPDAERNRQVHALLLPGTPEIKMFELLNFRFKLATLCAGELSLLLRYLPCEFSFTELFWQWLQSEDRDAFADQVSHWFLDARKKYRQARDLNQRLFLDDYAL